MSKSHTMCVVCRVSYANSRIKLFSAPKNPLRRQKWVESCGVTLGDHSKVCEKHFKKTDFINAPGDPIAKRARLMPSAVPSLLSDLAVFAEVYEVERPVDRSTQTSDRIINNCQSLQLRELKQKVAELEATVATLRKEKEDVFNIIEYMKKIFTHGQIKKMSNPNKLIRWSCEDISSAITLHASGPKAYRHLCEKGFPLPCADTLAKWGQKRKLEEDVLKLPDQT